VPSPGKTLWGPWLYLFCDVQYSIVYSVFRHRLMSILLVLMLCGNQQSVTLVVFAVFVLCLLTCCVIILLQ